MSENEGEDLWDENSQQQMDQVNPPDGFVAGMKRVYKNTVNGDEWGLARDHDKNLYYYKIIRGQATDELLPQNQPLPLEPDGYEIVTKQVYRRRNIYDEEVEQNESRQNDAGVNDGIAGQDNQPILQE